MKIMLINPPFSGMGGVAGHGGSAAPLNLAYLASYVRKHAPQHEFVIVDAEARRMRFDAIESEIRAFKPDLVGMTMATPAYLHVMEIVDRVKSVGKEIMVAAGGPHPSAHAAELVAESDIDFAFMGESEESFRILVEKLSTGGSLDDVPSIAYIDTKGEVCLTTRGELINDLDDIPFPARDLLPMHLYHVPATRAEGGGAMANMITSRGCPYDCSYCDSRVIWTRRTRARTPGNVVDEIQECYDRYGVRTFSFHDDIFPMNRGRTIEICKEIRRRKLDITWTCMTRVNFVWPDVMAEMKKAGCQKLLFGLESGSDSILKSIGKKATIQQAREAVKLAQSVGIMAGASFMIGNIEETEETVQQTVDFAKSLDLDTVAFFVAVPYPGTELYRQAKELGYIRKDLVWEDFAVVGKGRSPMELPHLPSERIRELQIQALRSYYLRPSYMFKKLTSMRNLTQLKSLARGARLLAELVRPQADDADYETLKLRQSRHTHKVLDQINAGGNPGETGIPVTKKRKSKRSLPMVQ